MARKNLAFLTAKLADTAVQLRFYKSVPYYNQAKQSARATNPVIRIYRLAVTDCHFNNDGPEYFDGCRYQDAVCIFEGELPAGNDRQYVYTDPAVMIGTTYAYWVSADAGEPTGPSAVRVRDPRVWWPQAEIERRMAALAATYPALVTIRQFGRTEQNRPINGLLLGNVRSGVAMVGAIHPGEAGPELILAVAERLAREESDLLVRTGLAILPSVNIDVRERLASGYPHYLRKNANGVDLNRNFNADWERVESGYGYYSDQPEAATYRGPYPESEDETKAVMCFLEAVSPRAVYSCHCLACICDATFFCSRDAEGDKPYREACLQAIIPYARGFTGLEPDPAPLYHGCSAGSLPAYLYEKYRIPGFDLEFSGDASVLQADQTTYALLCEYQAKHYNGVKSVLQSLDSKRALKP